MKKLLIVVLFILLSAWPAFSQTAIISSGLTTSDWSVVTSSCFLYGVEVITTSGASDATVIVYDNASAASGTIAFKGTIAAANNFGGVMFPNPVEMFNGIYVDVTGTGAAYIIYWKKR